MSLLCICTVLIYVVIVVRINRGKHSHPGSSSNTMAQRMTIKALKTLSVETSITLIVNNTSFIIAFYSEFYRLSENIRRFYFTGTF